MDLRHWFASFTEFRSTSHCQDAFGIFDEQWAAVNWSQLNAEALSWRSKNKAAWKSWRSCLPPSAVDVVIEPFFKSVITSFSSECLLMVTASHFWQEAHMAQQHPLAPGSFYHPRTLCCKVTHAGRLTEKTLGTLLRWDSLRGGRRRSYWCGRYLTGSIHPKGLFACIFVPQKKKKQSSTAASLALCRTVWSRWLPVHKAAVAVISVSPLQL